jgi:hypothetical protein
MDPLHFPSLFIFPAEKMSDMLYIKGRMTARNQSNNKAQITTKATAMSKQRVVELYSALLGKGRRRRWIGRCDVRIKISNPRFD